MTDCNDYFYENENLVTQLTNRYREKRELHIDENVQVCFN
jgi:hypothetical protein